MTPFSVKVQHFLSFKNTYCSMQIIWGGVGIFGFADQANFWIGFLVFALETSVFRFWCLNCQVCGFLQFGLWFLSWMMAVVQIFLYSAFYGFSCFAREIIPCNRTKIVIPRDHFYSISLPFLFEEWMTSLVCLVTVIWIITAAKHTMKSPR